MLDYILQNWVLILVLAAFSIALRYTVFMDAVTIRRMYVLIVGIFLLSIVVYLEFLLADRGTGRELRVVLMAIRYSATPFIVAQVIITLIKKQRWFLFLPAIVLTVVDFVSIFTGVVFRFDDSGVFSRGPLGMLPFLVAGLYCIALLVLLFKRCNRQAMEIIPIVFLCVALLSGLLFPFVFGKAYANIFCTTMAVALFGYYEFQILQLTKKDSLTGLLNRHAFYADLANNPEDISALVSIDMNGLKAVNDTEGHAAGDEAISTLGRCFQRALKRRQSAYRIGGDEFVILCRRCSHDELLQLVERIRRSVAETPYSVAVGYSERTDGAKSANELLRESDEMMYAEKARHYAAAGLDRRKRRPE